MLVLYSIPQMSFALSGTWKRNLGRREQVMKTCFAKHCLQRVSFPSLTRAYVT